ncbi:MAG: prephenate dehydratase [Chloroflexi bacterium]|nr:prephenate dehydratase [Chloroflexota bacterium]
MKRIAYLGPAGTFTEEVTILHDPTAIREPFSSIPAVASAVETGMADEGVVPIENSLEGSVSITLDLLIHESDLLIRQELVLPVRHFLLVRPGTRFEDVRRLVSHPQALGQCRRFIDRCFPKADVVPALSTAAAVEEVAAGAGDAAAIGTRRAAALYGAEILASNIQDRTENSTRFVVLSRTDHAPTGKDKTSIAFDFAADRPGLLVSVLQEFAERNINLTKVESRPNKESLGRYIFLVDLEGHRAEPVMAEVLDRVRAKASFFKVFGSYPRFPNGNGGAQSQPEATSQNPETSSAG